MKKITKYFLSIIIIFSLFLVASSCSSFVDTEELKVITSIERVVENGVVKMVIKYQDDTIAPDEFIIPSGDDGNGIEAINTLEKEDGKGKIIEIKFTDHSVLPVYFEIANGRSVVGIESEINEDDGQIYMWVKYDDETVSEKFLLPRGKDGKDGVSFIGYDYEVNEDGSQTYYFHFDQDTPDVVVEIPAPREGNGVKSMYSMEDDNDYILVINYTNGETDEVRFSKPTPTNKWIQGSTAPSSSDGVDGDYFFDTYHKAIYVKEYGSWVQVVSFDNEQEICRIKFDLNDTLDGGPSAKMPAGSRLSYMVRKNTYFQNNGYGEIPVPTRDGYVFVGWYRTKTITSVNSAFTDFTIVLTDLELYAIWEAE